MTIETETYSAEVKCTNCGWEGSTEIQKGTPVKDAECPQCGVKALEKKES